MGQIGGDLVLVEGLGSGKWMGIGRSAQVAHYQDEKEPSLGYRGPHKR